MAYLGIDVVKAEKADAMRSYNRRRNFAYFLRITGALALLLCCFKWFPEIKDMGGSAYFSVLSQQFYLFLLINFLILLIFHLSTTPTNNNVKNDAAFECDIYDQYASHSATSLSRQATSNENKQLVVTPVLEVPAEEDVLYEKQMIVCDNISDYPPMEKNPVRDLTVVDDYGVKKEEKCFKRSRSERRERVERGHRPEFRRSETEIGRELVFTGCYASVERKSMNEMNNEEFRLIIEDFIASQKKSLREENIALASKEKREYMAITYASRVISKRT